MTELKFLTNQRVCERVKELMRKIEEREAMTFKKLILETQEPQCDNEWQKNEDDEDAPMSQWPLGEDEKPPAFEPMTQEEPTMTQEEPTMTQAQAEDNDDEEVTAQPLCLFPCSLLTLCTQPRMSQKTAPPPKTCRFEDDQLFK
eukprot:343251-Rhodomonas_salina.1